MKKLKNKKKELNKKNFLIFIIENGENLTEVDEPKDIKPVLDLRVKLKETSILKDLVQGDVQIDNNTIEDFIILRNDGTPTYNLSATVDDHQMNMTHIIRGDDHKINTFKQMQIYVAMRWELPQFAHIPLIHTIEGKKLSKRDNASTLDDYSKIGIMPDALRNLFIKIRMVL